MSLSDKFKKKRESVQSERERLALERAQNSTRRLLESDQFRLSALALPESQMAVDAILENAVKECLDPRAAFIDTLRAKGFRQAEIRKMVSNLYNMYKCLDDSSEAENVSYEDKLVFVADYVCAHQELYNTLDPENLRM